MGWRRTLLLTYFCCGYLDFIYVDGNNLLPKPSKNSIFLRDLTEYGYFTKDKVLYAQAISQCDLWEGRLAAIKDEEIQQHIVSNMPIRSCPFFYYIGLIRHGDNWKWPDNTIFREGVNFSNWRHIGNAPCDKEPNGYTTCRPPRVVPREQNTTQISGCNSARQHIGNWFDKDGSTSSWYFICERTVGNYTIWPTTTAAMSTRGRRTRYTTTRRTQRVRTSTRRTTTTREVVLKESPVNATTLSSAKITTTSVGITERTSPEPLTEITTEIPVTSTPNATNSTSESSLPFTKEWVTPSSQTKMMTSIIPASEKGVTDTVSKEMQTSLRQRVFDIDQCLKNLLLDLSLNCNLEEVFGRNFTVSNWENELSPKLGKIFFSQKENSEKTITLFSGLVIRLFKASFESDLNRIFGNNFDDKRDAVVPFFDGTDSPNRFIVDRNTLVQALPFSVVAAEIQSSLWYQDRVDFWHPARPFSSYGADENKGKLNSHFKFFPSEASVLSFKLYEPSRNSSASGEVESKSIPVSPIISLKRDNTAYDIEKNSNWKIPVNGVSYSCRFVNDQPGKNSSWSTSGCHSKYTMGGSVYCSCNHTTTFGVIVAVRAIEIPPVVTTIATVLEILTIVSLALTVFLLLWLRRSMHSDRTVIQINLALSLLFAHLFIILGDSAMHIVEPTFCKTCAVLSHFFLLSTACWMLNEGIVLFFKTYKKALSFNVKKVFPYLAVSAWGFPLIYVCVCAGIGFSKDIYLDKKSLTAIDNNRSMPMYVRCWPGVSNGMIYTVVAPIILILTITTLIAIKTSIAINKMSRASKRMQPSCKHSKLSNSYDSTASSTKSVISQSSVKVKHAAVALRAVVLLLPVLGVTWVLAFFVNIPNAELPFIIVHSVISGLQGVFIFYIYCIQNSLFRRVFKRKWRDISNTHMGTNIYSQKSTKNHSHTTHSQTR